MNGGIHLTALCCLVVQVFSVILGKLDLREGISCAILSFCVHELFQSHHHHRPPPPWHKHARTHLTFNQGRGKTTRPPHAVFVTHPRMLFVPTLATVATTPTHATRTTAHATPTQTTLSLSHFVSWRQHLQPIKRERKKLKRKRNTFSSRCQTYVFYLKFLFFFNDESLF